MEEINHNSMFSKIEIHLKTIAFLIEGAEEASFFYNFP